MKTLPLIFLCLLVLLAAPSGIWCGEEKEYQFRTDGIWKRSVALMVKRGIDIFSTSQRED
uniref:Venom peptide Ht267 n=1 Tax=Hadogenes troglodytes TaxID=1577150 RepID=A0A1B3IJ77_9SCOR|nr:venom peptide Ht267 [Hadogenes troglodytes]